MKQTLIFISLAFLAACTSPLEKTYSQVTFEQDSKELKAELDTADLQLLVGSILRLSFEGKDMSTMTYGDILENGKVWKAEQDRIKAEQKALQEKAAREEAERIERLQSAVMVTCYKKSYVELDYQDYLTYGFAIENKTDKEIRAIKGVLRFTDLFDDEISTIRFTYDERIAAKATNTWNAQTDYNQFKDEDVTLRNKDLEDLKIVWEPIKIIFEDGTALE